MKLNAVQHKVLSFCHNGEYEKAWLYWKMMGYEYGIFLGEVPASEFITGDALAEAIGLTAGVSQHSNETWLKFLLKNELIYVSMKSLRHNISWDDICQVGAVYGSGDYGTIPTVPARRQDAAVTIDNHAFNVTLLRGANGGVDPTPCEHGHNLSWIQHSEWNKLLYSIHSGKHTRTDQHLFGQWESYGDKELTVHNAYGHGSYCWTQETYSGRSQHRIVRGYYGITYVDRFSSDGNTYHSGWRPASRRRVF